METRKPWDRQKELKKDHDNVWTPEKMYEMIGKIPDRRTQCLVAIIYLTDARVSEVVQYVKYNYRRVALLDEAGQPILNKKGIPKQKIVWKNPTIIHPDLLPFKTHSIRKRDIIEAVEKETPIVIFKIRNLKNKTRHSKESVINLDRQINLRLYEDYVLPYLSGKAEDEELFKIQRNTAEKDIVKGLGVNVHWIRHLRTTHLSTIHGLRELELMKVAGWTDTRPAKHYYESDWRDYLHKL